jgi:hypothetical protein
MMPVGALLAGVLATALGVRAALWILTALIAASGLTFLLTPMRHLRDLPRRPDPSGHQLRRADQRNPAEVPSSS